MVDWAHSDDVFVIQSVETLEEIVTQLCDPSSSAANVCTLPANFTHTHTDVSSNVYGGCFHAPYKGFRLHSGVA